MHADTGNILQISNNIDNKAYCYKITESLQREVNISFLWNLLDENFQINNNYHRKFFIHENVKKKKMRWAKQYAADDNI